MPRVTANSRPTASSATASALRPGARSTGMPLRGGGGDVDVGGVAAARADGDEREVEDRALHAVGLDDEQVGALGRDPLGELLGVVEAQRLVVDPRVEHDVGEALGACRGPAPRNGAVTRARWRSVMAASLAPGQRDGSPGW